MSRQMMAWRTRAQPEFEAVVATARCYQTVACYAGIHGAPQHFCKLMASSTPSAHAAA